MLLGVLVQVALQMEFGKTGEIFESPQVVCQEWIWQLSCRRLVSSWLKHTKIITQTLLPVLWSTSALGCTSKDPVVCTSPTHGMSDPTLCKCSLCCRALGQPQMYVCQPRLNLWDNHHCISIQEYVPGTGDLSTTLPRTRSLSWSYAQLPLLTLGVMPSCLCLHMTTEPQDINLPIDML